MSVECNPRMQMGATLSVTIDGVGTQQFVLSEYDRTSPKYSSTTTPPITKIGMDELAMTGSAVTLDLTAVPNQVEGAQTFSGLKIVAALFQNPNAAAITVDIGGSNGYAINGADAIIIPAGGTVMLDFANSLSDVDGTHKTLDITGTNLHVLNYILVAG